MREASGGRSGGEFIAIRPGPAEDLATAMQRAGEDADELLDRVRRALIEGGESAPGATRTLDDVGEWGREAAADLRWRVAAMVALDRTYLTSGGMVAGLLPFASRQAYELALRQAQAGLDRVLGDPALRGDAAARAEAVARWAAALPPGVLEAVAAQAPGLLGNLDGIPLPTRYAINRQRAEAQLVQVDRVLAGPLDPEGRAALEERRAALAALVTPGPDGQQRQVLAFSPLGDGMAVEVFGDLTTADHVALLVPGMGSDLDNFPGLAANASDLQRNAQLNHAAPGQQVATIAWFGYDAPNGELEAAQTDSARHGAPQLIDFLAGQDLADDAHTTVIGHSYGSVVTGHALAAGFDIDDAVVIGSPGVGQGVTADDLRPQGGEMYALRTDDDPIRYFDGHGGDPTNADFGAVVLAANPSDRHNSYGTIFGHSEYYTRNSLSLDNLAVVTVGQPHLLIAQTEPLDNPLSAGPFWELPTTMGDSFADALGNARDSVMGTPDTTVPPPP